MMSIDEVMKATEEKEAALVGAEKRQVLFGDMLRSDAQLVKKSYAKAAIEGRAPSFVSGVQEFLEKSELGKREDRPEVLLNKARIVRAGEGRQQAFLDCSAGCFPLRMHAFEQIAREMSAPPGYLVTLPPTIALDCLDYGFKKMPETKRTLRLENGEIRALVSKRYSAFDDRQACRLLYRALEHAGKLEQAQIEAWSTSKTSSVTVSLGSGGIEGQNKGYARHAYGPEGLGLRASVTMRNAELGNGSLGAWAAMRREWCSNGAVIEEAVMGRRSGWSRRHTGDWQEQAKDLADALLEIMQTAEFVLENAVPGALKDVFKPAELTKRLQSLKLTRSEREAVLNTIFAEAFGMYSFEASKIGTVNQAAIQEAGEVMRALEQAKKEEERDAVLEALQRPINGWNVINGITGVAREMQNVERSAELEAMGGKLLAEYLN